MKTLHPFFTLFLLFILFVGCSKTFDYTSIKKLPNSNTFEAQGYFTNDPIPMLVNDPKWLSINTPMPTNAYLFLSGSILDSVVISPDSTKYYGALLTVRGTVDQDSKISNKNALEVENIEVNSSSTSNRGPYIIGHCGLPTASPCTGSLTTPPPLCSLSTPSANKFALLFSGGKTLQDAKFRYWNDLEFMYLTLRSQYGFSDENMAVVYMDRRKENLSSPMNVGYTASPGGLDSAILYLKNRMGLNNNEDTLFVFVTNHGGGYDPAGATVFSGSKDSGSSPDEADFTTTMYDENICYYKPVSGDYFIKDDVWKTKWNTLLDSKSPRMIALYEPCFSGGFIRDMAGPKRVNIAAASQNAYSYGLLPDNVYDAFSYFFTAALYGRNADGTCLKYNPDNAPEDGQVSIWEAYLYAHYNDPGATHNHFLDDRADGIGVGGVLFDSPPSGTQGFISSSFFLKRL
ncbi:MAG: hypothetical protein Q8K92_24110 [Leadbetterella sp.]|nr:hypothetical protein [Leadbetterella sp.]